MSDSNADIYLANLLRREAVNTGEHSPVRGVIATLRPAIVAWANNYLAGLTASGSFAKGTAIASGTDIDLFVSLRADTPENLRDIYSKLFNRMQELGYTPKPQNVSINIRVGTYDVDLVPAKRQDYLSADHSLYRRRADTWTKTNIDRHITTVRNAGRINETRILKLWRNQKGFSFPSFYLELTVIDALYGRHSGNLSNSVRLVLEYLRDSFASARVVDPANTNNIISDDLTAAEKNAIVSAARDALTRSWAEFVS